MRISLIFIISIQCFLFMYRYILPAHDIIISWRVVRMDKFDLILEKLNKIEEKTNKLDKIESDINALKADSKEIKQELKAITEATANIMESITNHEIRIQKLEQKAV